MKPLNKGKMEANKKSTPKEAGVLCLESEGNYSLFNFL